MKNRLEIPDFPETYEFWGKSVPTNIMKGLERYINHKSPVGQFLTAVLENNLFEACSRADENSIEGLPAIVGFIYNEAPGNCWGSKEIVEKWLGGE